MDVYAFCGIFKIFRPPFHNRVVKNKERAEGEVESIVVKDLIDCESIVEGECVDKALSADFSFDNLFLILSSRTAYRNVLGSHLTDEGVGLRNFEDGKHLVSVVESRINLNTADKNPFAGMCIVAD
jgi:hypothetical protein